MVKRELVDCLMASFGVRQKAVFLNGSQPLNPKGDCAS